MISVSRLGAGWYRPLIAGFRREQRSARFNQMITWTPIRSLLDYRAYSAYNIAEDHGVASSTLPGGTG